MRKGYIAKVTYVNLEDNYLSVYSDYKEGENLVDLRNIGYESVALKNLNTVKIEELKHPCYIVLQNIHKEGKYIADVFLELRGNEVRLDGWKGEMEFLNCYKIYQLPFKY